jgi:ubiquinone/menaquinone biosynthesis C-methylase UbiE
MGLRNRLFALTYDRLMASTEQGGLAEVREELIGEATGNALEVGAGTGHNLPYYRPAVTSLTLTEPDPAMMRRLQRAASTADRTPTVVRAPAEDLPFDDATFDTVVCTLVLCGVEDQPRAAREIRRVLTPGGRLLLVEHVRAEDEALARRQDRMNWLNRLLVGCDCNRPTQQTLQRTGFAIDRLAGGELPKSPSFVRPMIVGAASCPTDVRAPSS